jgi:hypothetical protein
LIKKFEKPSGAIFSWLYIAPSSRDGIVKCLKQWMGPIETRYPNVELRETVSENRMRGGMQGPMHEKTLPGCQDDRRFFRDFTFIPPPKQFTEPLLKELIEAHKAGKGTAIVNLEEYLSSNWKTNVTVIDVDWEARREKEPHCEDLVNLDFDPLEVTEYLQWQIPPSNKKTGQRVMDRLCDFFAMLATSLSILTDKSSMTMEFLVGEMTDTMERLRYDCLEYRSEHVQDGLTPSKFPKLFDRIHLSNIP